MLYNCPYLEVHVCILPSFPGGFLCDKAQINTLCNTTLSVLGAWPIWRISFPCNSTEGWSRSLLLRVGMAPLPSFPSSTSHALSSACLEGVWEGVQAAYLGSARRQSQEMSSPPSLTWCHTPLPVVLGLWSQWRQGFVEWPWGYGQNLAFNCQNKFISITSSVNIR